MNLKIKNDSKVYEVVDSSWFHQNNETISEYDGQGEIYGFLLESVENTDIEPAYKKWLKEHEADYYFEIVKSNDNDFYAVAGCRDTIVSYAVQIENPDEDAK